METDKTSRNLLSVAQRAMERAMLGITLRDKKKSTWIREKTKVKDVVQVVKQQKWRWAGHVARMNLQTGTHITRIEVQKDQVQDGKTRLKSISSI